MKYPPNYVNSCPITGFNLVGPQLTSRGEHSSDAVSPVHKSVLVTLVLKLPIKLRAPICVFRSYIADIAGTSASSFSMYPKLTCSILNSNTFPL